jgi:tetratricopeptide (TPR) repeat protein
MAGPSNQLQNNVVYLAQEWARAAYANGDVEAMFQTARQVVALFPGLPSVRRGPAAIIRGAVIKKAEAGDFEAAIALAERGAEILPAEEANDLVEFGYDKWGKFFIKKEQWEDAVEIYDTALKRLPDSGLLKQNRAFCLSQAE